MNWKNPVMKNTTVNPEKLIKIRDCANEEINTKKHLKKRHIILIVLDIDLLNK